MYDDFIYYIILYRISALQMDHDYALYIHMGRCTINIINYTGLSNMIFIDASNSTR